MDEMLILRLVVFGVVTFFSLLIEWQYYRDIKLLKKERPKFIDFLRTPKSLGTIIVIAILSYFVL